MTGINSQEALIILTKWSDGSRYTMENEIRPYSAPEVQHLIDSTVSVNCSVTAVKRLDLESGTVEDITEDFDIPEVPDFVGAYRPTPYNALQAAE
jgi:hypothetical protein